jgi:HK97 family phage portal protein
MSILNRFSKAFQRKAVAVAAKGLDFGNWFVQGGDMVRSLFSNVAGAAGPVQDTNSVVAACLRYINDTIPEARLRVKMPKDGSDEVVPNHALYKLLKRPNRSTGYLWRDILGAIGMSLALDGNAYLRLRRNGFSQIAALEYVPHDLCEPREDYPGSGLTHYFVYTSGQGGRVDPEEIIHFRIGIDPSNTLKGWSSFRAAMLEVLTDNEAAVYSRVMMRNLGVIGWIIQPEEGRDTITPKEADSIKEKFLTQFTGEERGKPFIPTRKIKVESVGHTPDKMLVRETRMTPEERICAVFRIAAIVAGVGAGLQRSTMANTKEQREATMESCNCPMWAAIADTLSARFEDLGLLKNGEFVEFDLGTVRALQEDEDKKHDRARKNFKDGIWTRGEARQYTSKQADAEDDVYYTEIEAQRAEATMLANQAKRSEERARMERETA